MSSAHVRSLDGLVELKAAFCTFAADATEAISSLTMAIQRFECWLDEQMKHWAAAVREGEDAVFQAKQDLTRRRIMKMGDRPPDCSEQEEALERARQRLAHAEDKLERTRHWVRQFPQALIDYKGPMNQLVGMIEGDLPKADGLLEQKIAALDAYTQIAPESPPQ